MVLLILGASLGCESEEDIARDISKQVPAYEVTALQLWAEYEDSETAADEKYKGEVLLVTGTVSDIGKSSGPHHQDSGEAKIRESTAGVSRKPSSDCKAWGCSSKHLCGLTAWNT